MICSFALIYERTPGKIGSDFRGQVTVPLAIPATPTLDQLELPKKPVKKQAAFAPYSKQRAVNEKSSEWDESDWIG